MTTRTDPQTQALLGIAEAAERLVHLIDNGDYTLRADLQRAEWDHIARIARHALAAERESSTQPAYYFRGTWSPDETYSLHDIVTFWAEGDGSASTWEAAELPTRGVLPSSDEAWRRYAAK